jgi:6-pyruvoyltetrahydropterin/6-carboxytetrahydropterin synthase
MQLSREFHFSMGHTLHNYEGKCANLHGHNYRMIVTLEGQPRAQTEMLVDFGDFKNMVNGVLEDYDHHFLIFAGDPRAQALKQIDDEVRYTASNPTCEFLVDQLFWKLHEDVVDYNYSVKSVQLWETEDCYAEI